MDGPWHNYATWNKPDRKSYNVGKRNVEKDLCGWNKEILRLNSQGIIYKAKQW